MLLRIYVTAALGLGDALTNLEHEIPPPILPKVYHKVLHENYSVMLWFLLFVSFGF
jgi:hypothetical protein